MKIKHLLFLFAALCFIQSAASQNYKLEKRIYLLDVTASMKGEGAVKTENIFGEVIEKLSTTLSQIGSPDCEVVVIPFTNKCHSAISQTINSYDCDQSQIERAKDSLIRAVVDISIQKGDTNIADAWSRGVEEIDPDKINYIFLLTDGLHNTGVEKEILFDRLKAWQEISKSHYYFAFYVMLTPNAKESEIVTIIDKTRQMWLIESMDVNATFITTDINLYANVFENKSVSILFKSNNHTIFENNIDIELTLSSNPYYEIVTTRHNLNKQEVTFELKELQSKLNIPNDVDLDLSIIYDKESYPLVFFTPEVIRLHLKNQGLRTMSIKELKNYEN